MTWYREVVCSKIRLCVCGNHVDAARCYASGGNSFGVLLKSYHAHVLKCTHPQVHAFWPTDTLADRFLTNRLMKRIDQDRPADLLDKCNYMWVSTAIFHETLLVVNYNWWYISMVVSNIFIFHNIWDVILPIDELIFFKMVIAPPTSIFRWFYPLVI